MTETTSAPEPGAEPEPEARKRRRAGLATLILRWIGGIVAALILAIVIFLLLFNWDWLRPPLARLLSAQLHRPVKITGHLRVHLFSWTPTATLGGLEIGEPGWMEKEGAAGRKDFADVGLITVKVRLISLLTGHLVLPLVQLDQPQVAMFQAKSGISNWDFSNGKKPGKPAKLPPIQNFVINDGKLDITSLQRKLTFGGTINAYERDSAGGRQGFRLGGAGELNGKPFQMNVTGGPLLNVRRNVPYPFDARVSAGETVVTAKGEVPHPFDLGHVFGDVSIQGRDLADLYYLTGIALPNTPPYRIAGHLDREEKVYQFQRFTGRVGSSDLEGSLKADMSQGNRPDVTGALVSRRLDFKDLGSLFGATGKNAPAGPRLAVQAAKPGAYHRLLPDATLDASRVRAMDAHVTYKADTVIAAPTMPLRQVSLGVTLDHGLLTLDPIDLQFPQGRLSGTASIDARHAVQANAVDLRLSNVQMQNFMPKAKGGGPPAIAGTLDARAKIEGDGDSVHKAAATSNGRVVAVIPGGQVRQAFAELIGVDAAKGLMLLLNKNQQPTTIRCAVADFQVVDGVLHARQFVIDTDVVRIDGSGQVNLNDETINLVIKGHPKKFRLFHLDAPITVGGHLASPAFGVKPMGAIAQAGVGVVLGAAVFPPLAILPFLSLGGAHDANCVDALQTATAAGAPVKRSQVVHAERAAAAKPH